MNAIREKKAVKLNRFNMIELVLAISIMAIGMVAVLAILPVGLTEDRVSKVQNYSATASDSIYSYVSRELSDNWDDTLESLPDSKPDSQLSSSDDWSQSAEGNIYQPGTDYIGVYGIKMASADGDITDAVGEVLIWKTPINNASIGGVIKPLSTSDAIGINMEVSFPIEKPYDKRKKNNYYFEAYSNNCVDKAEENADAEVETIQESDETPGEIIINETATLKIKIVDTQFYNGDEPVYVRVCIYEPGDTDGEIIKPFKTSSSVERRIVKDDEWSMEVPAGTKYTVQALHYRGGPCTAYWSTNENQVLTLLNGDQPPLFIPGAMGQVSPDECIEDYVNTETGNIVLNENQVLYLYEIGQTVEFYTTNSGYTYRNSGFDRQDVIVLAEITPNE